jgi:peptidoglycan-associated lipoprotein
MTVYLFILLTFAIPALVQAQSGDVNKTSRDHAEAQSLMTWEKNPINLGKVIKGNKKSSAFVFQNTGKEDIVIEIVTSCECTELDWPIDPVKPGEKGTIDFIFDSTDKDKSEEIVVDIILANINPKTGYQVVEQVAYKYELIVN